MGGNTLESITDETKIAHFLGNANEDGNDWLYNVIERMVELHNNVINTLFPNHDAPPVHLTSVTHGNALKYSFVALDKKKESTELDNLIESFWNSQLDEPNFDYNALQEEIRVRYLSHPVKIDDSIENGKVKKNFHLSFEFRDAAEKANLASGLEDMDIFTSSVIKQLLEKGVETDENLQYNELVDKIHMRSPNTIRKLLQELDNAVTNAFGSSRFENDNFQNVTLKEILEDMQGDVEEHQLLESIDDPSVFLALDMKFILSLMYVLKEWMEYEGYLFQDMGLRFKHKFNYGKIQKFLKHNRNILEVRQQLNAIKENKYIETSEDSIYDMLIIMGFDEPELKHFPKDIKANNYVWLMLYIEKKLSKAKKSKKNVGIENANNNQCWNWTLDSKSTTNDTNINNIDLIEASRRKITREVYWFQNTDDERSSSSEEDEEGKDDDDDEDKNQQHYVEGRESYEKRLRTIRSDRPKKDVKFYIKADKAFSNKLWLIFIFFIVVACIVLSFGFGKKPVVNSPIVSSNIYKSMEQKIHDKKQKKYDELERRYEEREKELEKRFEEREKKIETEK